jgi:hypothetical protein
MSQRLETCCQHPALCDIGPDVGVEGAALAGEFAVPIRIAISRRSTAADRSMRNENALSPHAHFSVGNRKMEIPFPRRRAVRHCFAAEQRVAECVAEPGVHRENARRQPNHPQVVFAAEQIFAARDQRGGMRKVRQRRVA